MQLRNVGAWCAAGTQRKSRRRRRRREREREREREIGKCSRVQRGALVLVGDFKAFASAVKRKKAKVKANLCFGLLFCFFLCVCV